MRNIIINLDTFDKIKKFINITTVLSYDLNLSNGRYVVDGKSIMGILRLDLTKPITVDIVNSNEYPKELEEFMV